MAPGSDERQIGIIPNGHTTFSEKNNLRYLRLIRKYSSIIVGQYFAHLHSGELNFNSHFYFLLLLCLRAHF